MVLGKRTFSARIVMDTIGVCASKTIIVLFALTVYQDYLRMYVPCVYK